MLRMVFVTMSLINSYNFHDYFPPSIILITLPMSEASVDTSSATVWVIIVESFTSLRGTTDPMKSILIWYTGSSYGLALFRSGFIDDVNCDIPVKDMTKIKGS